MENPNQKYPKLQPIDSSSGSSGKNSILNPILSKNIITILIVVVVISVAGILLLLPQLKIDKCLDRGSRWDYESSRCVNIDTSGWQTYHSKEFGFEVKYPIDWALQKRQDQIEFENFEKRLKF